VVTQYNENAAAAKEKLAGPDGKAGFLGTLTPLEKPITDAVPVVEKAILDAKTAVDNKGGAATKGTVGSGTTQPK
jgi:hypothetical protein